jgi:tetratricopeptide (TPR) repeat protein
METPKQFCQILQPNPCEPPYLHYMRAARGWLELGDVQSALSELKFFDEIKSHPDVLILRWDIHAAMGDWDHAYQIAQELIKVIPDDPKSWFNRAEALRHMAAGGIQPAYEALLRGVQTFNENYLFHLWLARYACLAGKLEEANHWLGRASELGMVKQLVLDDPQLAAIWEEAQRLGF